MDRVAFKWKAPVADLDSGQSVDVTVVAFWSPDFDGVRNSVSEAACAQAYMASGKVKKFIPNGLPELLPA